MMFNLLARSLILPTARTLNSGHLALAVTANYKIIDAASGDINSNRWPLFNYLQNRGAARKGKRIARNLANRKRAAERRRDGYYKKKDQKFREKGVKLDKAQYQFLDASNQDSTLPEIPDDNVYFVDKFRRKKFSFDGAIEFHKQVVHPDVMNQPEALVTATLEINLKMTLKKRRYIQKIDSTVSYPHVFKYQLRPRKIVALTKDLDEQEKARNEGASLAGAADITDLLKKGLLTERDFDHLVCKTDYLAEFAEVKGMKSKPFFPTKARGNFGDDIVQLVKIFKDGVDYSLKKMPDEPAVGLIECHFGTLNMTHEQLRENFICLCESIIRFQPNNLADNKQFFERVAITTPATEEMFFIRFWELFDDFEDPEVLAREAEEEQAASKS